MMVVWTRVMAREVLASRWVWGINFIKSQQDLWMGRMYSMREGEDNPETEGLGMGWVLGHPQIWR